MSMETIQETIQENQATINIGTIGHVAHGKSTIVKALTGIKTTKFREELARNITIHLGYANAKIYKCDSPHHPRHYKSFGSNIKNPICECGSSMTLKKHVSFVDCPGHDIYMSTMLSGTSVMDASLLLIASNEICPQPQTLEHLAAMEIMKMENIIILQTKLDLVNPREAMENHEQIVDTIDKTIAEGSPIIPITITPYCEGNVDVLCEYICRKFPEPKRDLTSDPLMYIVRTFNINPQNTEIDDIKGGVLGGSIVRGILHVGDDIEIRPGITMRTADGKIKCSPLFSKIVSLHAEKNSLQYAIPGGLIGVGTNIDPTLTINDRLIGQVVGLVGKLPEILSELTITHYLLNKILGTTPNSKNSFSSKNSEKIKKISVGEMLMLNVNNSKTGGRVTAVSDILIKVDLTIPICASTRDKVSISRLIDKHWRLIGCGIIVQ